MPWMLCLLLWGCVAKGDVLTSGQTLKRLVGPGRTQDFTVAAASGAYLELQIEPGGTRLEIDVRSGDRIVLRKKLWSGQMLPASTCWIAADAGGSIVVVRSLEAKEERSFAVGVSLRPATVQDGARARGCALAEEGDAAGQLALKLEKWQVALYEFEKAGDVGRQAEAYSQIGLTLWDLGRTADAVASHEKAVQAWGRTENKRRRAAAMHRYGVGLLLINQIARAKEVLRDAESLAREAGDHAAEADALTDLAMQISREGRYGEAISMVNQAVTWKREAGDRKGESEAQNTRGIIQQNAGLLTDAQSAYERSLDLRRQLGDGPGEAQCLNNLATVYTQLGEPRKARELLEAVLAIRKRIAGPQAIANTQHNLGVQCVLAGEYDRALELFEDALTVWRSTTHRAGEAATLTEMGRAYARLSLTARAEAAYGEARKIQAGIGNRRGEALALIGLGDSFESGQRPAAAETAFRQAATVARDGKFPQEQMRATHGLGRIHARMGNYALALTESREAVELARKTNRQDMIACQNTLGRVLELAGNPDEAEVAIREALRQAVLVESGSEERTARTALARLLLTKGDLEGARHEVRTAMARLEAQRIQVASPDLRAQFLSRYRDIFRLAAEVLMRLGETRDAFTVSEQGRARALLDLLEAGKGGDAAGGQFFETERDLRQVLSAKAERLTRMLVREAKASEVAPIRKEIASLADAHARLRERMAREDPRWLKQTTPEPLEEIQRRIGPGEALVEFLLSERSSFVWMVTGRGIDGVTLAPRAEIEALAEEFAGAHMERKPATRKLADVLLSSLKLQGIRKLYIVADGGLHTIPFAALQGLAGIELVMLPSAGVLAKLPARAPRIRNAAVFADAVYETGDAQLRASNGTRAGARVGEETLRFPRLRFSRLEAETIQKLSATGSLSATGFAATRIAALKAAGGSYDALHFATHAILEERQPELSGLVLSLYDAQGRPVDGFVRMQDVMRMELRSKLVVLSACQTAIGKSVDGEGLIGLSRAFLAAGASGVVATLWQVDDAATASLMRVFYEGLFRKGLSPSKALQAAQQAVRAQPQWAHPYYWAGFVYSGR